MKLYIIPGACSLAVNIALREAGIRFDLIRVDGQTGKIEDGTDFRKVNPKGYVPALQLDDGQVLTENVAVLQYVADRNPATKLAPPAGTMDRYRLMEWLSFINSEVHKGFSPLFSADATDEVKQYALNKLKKRLDYLQGTMGDRYLMGDQFTVADAYLFTVVGWGAEVGVDIAHWPNLQLHQSTIARRPQVIAALASEA